MKKLIMGNAVTLEVCFEGEKPWDLSFHQLVWGPELEAMSLAQLQEASMLVFGTHTYTGMADYWTHADAADPVTPLMNSIAKVVCRGGRYCNNDNRSRLHSRPRALGCCVGTTIRSGGRPRRIWGGPVCATKVETFRHIQSSVLAYNTHMTERLAREPSAEQTEPGTSFNWTKERERLLNALRTRNDPRGVLEYLLRFPDKHMETECWDDYLIWVYENSDRFLEMASREMQDVADEVLLLLNDTYAFMTDRQQFFREYGYEAKAAELREKILRFFRENGRLFEVRDAPMPYRLGLRLPNLARIAFLCREENPDVRANAHRIAVEALKAGLTDEDRREDDALAHTDLFDVENAVEDLLLPEDIADVAFTVAERSGVEIDLREQRLRHASRYERRIAHDKHLREWVWAVTQLEGHAKGAAKELQDRFGIINFHHFPMEALKKQYDLRDADTPYGVVAGAQFDHNDAFIRFGDVGVLRSLYEQLSSYGVHLRIIEAGDLRALARHMFTLDAHYGDAHKISFALVRAHGGDKEVQLGNMYEERLSTRLIGRLRPESLKQFFIENPTILFDSCSVGADGGLAQKIATHLGATTQGPEGISHGIKSITVSGDATDLKFSITLNYDDERVATYGAAGNAEGDVG